VGAESIWLAGVYGAISAAPVPPLANHFAAWAPGRRAPCASCAFATFRAGRRAAPHAVFRRYVRDGLPCGPQTTFLWVMAAARSAPRARRGEHTGRSDPGRAPVARLGDLHFGGSLGSAGPLFGGSRGAELRTAVPGRGLSPLPRSVVLPSEWRRCTPVFVTLCVCTLGVERPGHHRHPPGGRRGGCGATYRVGVEAILGRLRERGGRGGRLVYS